MGNFADIKTKTVAQDFDDTYGELTVIEQTNMTVAVTKRIATRYRDESGSVAWQVKTLHLNISGEIVGVKTQPLTAVTPAWIPSGLLA